MVDGPCSSARNSLHFMRRTMETELFLINHNFGLYSPLVYQRVFVQRNVTELCSIETNCAQLQHYKVMTQGHQHNYNFTDPLAKKDVRLAICY